MLKSTMLVVTFYSAALAQTVETTPIKRISINEIHVQTGVTSESGSSGTLKEFQSLAPTSSLLKKDFTGYSTSLDANFNTNSVFAILLGVQFRDKEKNTYQSNPLLRIGFSYFSGGAITGNLYRKDRKTYDTVTLAPGNTVFLDSVTSTSTNMNYNYQQLQLDAALIFRTNNAARWSLFAGIGASVGLSINANTEINYNKFSHTETSSNANSAPAYSVHDRESVSEKIKNKSNLGISVYVPLGVDFRIGKKREFWKRTHLLYELRPTINVTSIPEMSTFTNASIQQRLGLKVTW